MSINENQKPAIFTYCEGKHNIRVVIISNEPWFVARDVCNVLKIKNISQALTPLDEDEKGIYKVYTPGGKQNTAVVSESGLYALIMRSNKPDAKKFRKWVTSEVLPAIRKNGKYEVPPTQNQVATIQDDFIASGETRTLEEVAKEMGMGRTRLMQILRDHHYLTISNLPYQHLIAQGFFEVKEVIKKGKPYCSTLVRPLGVYEIRRLLVQENAPKYRKDIYKKVADVPILWEGELPVLMPGDLLNIMNNIHLMQHFLLTNDDLQSHREVGNIASTLNDLHRLTRAAYLQQVHPDKVHIKKGRL